MFDQMIASYRKASEASLQAQGELLRQLAQPWSAPPQGTAASSDRARTLGKELVDASIDLLNRQRESADAVAKATIAALARSLDARDVRSPEDYRRLTEDVWHKLFDVFKNQSEANLRELQDLADKSFDLARKAGSVG